MIAVRDHIEQLGDAVPVVITFTGDRSRLAAYRDHLGIEFPVLSDTDRLMYHLFGAGRGSFRRVWSAGTIAMYARLIRKGRRLQRLSDDTLQLGADAVIDRAGRLHRLWLPPGPDARPSLSEIADVIASVPGSAA